MIKPKLKHISQECETIMCEQKQISDVYTSKSQLFDHLNLIFLKNFNCILYSQDHRT